MTENPAKQPVKLLATPPVSLSLLKNKILMKQKAQTRTKSNLGEKCRVLTKK